MRYLPVAAWVVLGAVALGTACRRDAAQSFVGARRGGVQATSAVQVTAIAAAAVAYDYDGNPVAAGIGSKYVLIDCRLAVPSNQVDVSDFQLVGERVSQLGTEANLGNNDDKDYFYWTYLDAAGRPLVAPPDSTGPLPVRLAYKVPAGIQTGYLFYWGLYWGPLSFPSIGP